VARAYTWDAENRLFRIEPPGEPGVGDRRIEYVYDYLSRRVEKRVYEWPDILLLGDRSGSDMPVR